MKRWIALGVLLCTIAVPANAGVSHEVVVGLEGDSSSEVTSSVNGAKTDLKDKIKNAHSLYAVQYTYFFTPLSEDKKSIELRRFYQHPATVSVGLAFMGMANKDTTSPFVSREDSLINSMLTVGGEYFFSTGTGLFLTLGGGTGTFREKVNGVVQPETEVKLGMSSLGVRQYVAENVELHFSFNGETKQSQPNGLPEETIKKNVTLLGVHGIIRDTVGLRFEIGGGRRKDESGVTIEYDLTAVNLEGAIYAGKQLSFRLDIEVEAENMKGLPSGFEHKNTVARTTLAATYWFSERFGMELPLYSEVTEKKTIIAGFGEQVDTVKNGGIGLYAAFRF